ncbi:MAG: CHAD domain-containing protein [Rhodospirillaceae bacterium]|nr:CHAD domain-containing protein [Rhodospirillaceae bacterium]
MKNQEIELKLALPGGAAVRPAALRKLLAAPTRATAKRMETSYFDTADCWLKNHGMALRVRRIGDQRIQTLKAPGSMLDGLQSFAEFEAPIEGNRPRLAAISDAKLRRRLDRAGVMTRLRPVFTTRFDRNAWLIRRGESQIEVALDVGSIGSKATEIPIAEIELELKAGNPVDLFHLAEGLVEDLPARLGLATKAARGYALALHEKPVPERAGPLDLTGKVTAGDAFSAIVRNCLAQLRANEAAILESEDDEAIHQFRVAIRRFRAAIGAFRELIDDGAHAAMSIDLRWLQRQFGPARDLDVLIAETLMPMAERMRDQAVIRELLEIARRARAEARRQAHLALENPRYAVMLLHIYRQLLTDDWRGRGAVAQFGLNQSARTFANRWLNRSHKRLVRLGGEHAALSETELHRLRLLGKKMRYGAQAFASLYDSKRTDKYLAHLSAIQDHLGSLNDAVVGRHLLTNLTKGLSDAPGWGSAESNLLHGIVLGWQSHRISGDLGGFQMTWEGFRAQRKFWGKANGVG